MNKTPACDFCDTPLKAPRYIVPESEYRMQVYVCPHCGLTQSIKKDARTKQKIKSTSAGPRFGNMRIGKGIRFNEIKHFLSDYIDLKHVKRILDIGSNRGDFVLWAHTLHSDAKITAVEPDSMVTGDYEHIRNINLIRSRYENTPEREGYYDFVFCSHTLEHANSARAMLMRIAHEINDHGLLFLEVPNIEIIEEPDIVEEFFIDKHTFHFYPSVLIHMLTSLGFEIIADHTTISNITLIARKMKRTLPPHTVSKKHKAVRATHLLINKYKQMLPENRNNLTAIADRLYEFTGRQRVVVWGAGRIFDALVHYGEFKTDRLAGIVDSYVYKHGLKHRNIPVLSPSALRTIDPHVVVILAKSSTDMIEKECRQYGVRHVIKFSDLLRSI